MNKIIKALTTLMIIVLLVVLIWVYLSYYRGNTSSVLNNEDYNSNVSALNIPNNVSVESGEGLVASIIKENTDKMGSSNVSTSGEDTSIYSNENETRVDNNENKSNDNQGEVSKEDETNNQNINNNSGERMPNTIIDIPNATQEPNDIMISSSTETSDSEKQKVLNEIDTALQNLLETVGKVQTVDEERLNATLSSEVIAP